MNPLAWAGLQSFVCSLVLTPIIRDVFRSYRVVDQPDQNRKVHVHPIPRVGGIAIAIAYVVTYWLARPPADQPVGRELSLIANLLPAGVIVFFTGLIDDFVGLKPLQKLLGQVVAAGVACWGGVLIEQVGGAPLSPIVGLPLTVAWLLLCTNAFNLVDGLDGLAAGVGLFATLTIFTAAMLQGNQPLAYATLPLAGCLLGFLCFNFNPATVFLGDGGSLLIGFLLGCFGVLWTQKTATLLGLAAPLMAMSLPLLDVVLCIVRRWLRNQPIFSADRGHIHHRLIDRGLSTRQAVLLLYGLCGLGAVFALAQSLVNDFYLAVFLMVTFIGAAWLGIRYLGYSEFMLAGRLLRLTHLRGSVTAQLSLSSFEKSMQEAASLDACWAVIVSACRTFGFRAVRLRAQGRLFQEWDPIADTHTCWTMRVPLNERDSLELAREIGSPVAPTVVAPFVELMAAAVSAKLKETAAGDSAAVLVQPGG